MSPRGSERLGTPARGCPQDCRTPLTASVLCPRLGTPPQPRGCSPKASASRHPRGAQSEARPGPPSNRGNGGDCSANSGPVLGAEGNDNREPAAHGAGGTALPPRLRLRYKARPTPPHPPGGVTAGIAHRRGRERRRQRQAGPPPLCESPEAAPLPAPPRTHLRATGSLLLPRTSGFRRGSGSGRYHREAGAGRGGERGGVGGWYIPPPPSCGGEAGGGRRGLRLCLRCLCREAAFYNYIIYFFR